MQAFELYKSALSKAAGDRGGHVIGHTKSGKPIYESQRHGGNAMSQPTVGFSSADHRDAAEAHLAHANKIKSEGSSKSVVRHSMQSSHDHMALAHKIESNPEMSARDHKNAFNRMDRAGMKHLMQGAEESDPHKAQALKQRGGALLDEAQHHFHLSRKARK